MQYELSILIAARNEEFLSRTVDDILKNKRGNTEIIVGLDGDWANPGIKDHPDVTIVYYPKSIGQRAMTNQLCKISKAKYVMKVDAHCAFDEGFDVKMTSEMQDNWTMVPTMRNLWVFDWICKNGHHRYQGPSGPCKECGEETKKNICWIPKQSPQSNSFCFDSEPHFQYFNEYCKRFQGKGDITETMSLQGSAFMLTREKYWELNISDEAFGSWGSQGIEVACKTWLSGGKVMVNHKTWYAHLFRTQGGDFSFPYPQPQKNIDRAKKFAKNLFFENKWEKQIYPLSWLVERFWPVKGWTEEDLKKIKAFDHSMINKETVKDVAYSPSKKPTKGIIFYSDNLLKVKIAKAVQNQLQSIGLPIVSCTLKPMPHFGKNIHLKLERGYLTMFKQQLAALEALDTDIVFFCEHDCLYHPHHFEFTPPKKDVFYYDVNVWKLRIEDGHALWVNNCRQVSGICVYRETALTHYRERVKYVEEHGYERNMGFEPGTHSRVKWQNPFSSESYMAKEPIVDIRHDKNMTRNRWSQDLFRNKKNCEGWTEGRCPKWAESLIPKI